MSAETQVVPTVCGSCHNSCSVNVTVQDGRIARISGRPGDPRTDGTVCSKALAAKQFVYDPSRLKYPLRRVGARGENKWQRITWDEALETIATEFNKVKEEMGPRAVGFYKGQASLWSFAYTMFIRLAHAFGTEVGMGCSECFVPRAIGEAVTYGGMPLYPDYENSNMIVLWGRQPAFSGATQMHMIFDARDRGAKLVAIDPLRFHMSAKADQFIRIEPGTDLALALAIIYTIVEEDLWDHNFVNKYSNDPDLLRLRDHVFGGNADGAAYTPEWAEKITGIPAGTIRTLARELATTKGVSILCGHGLEGRVSIAQTARAIAIIKVITGNIDAPGGDLFTSFTPKLNRKFCLNELVVPECKEDPAYVFIAAAPYNPPGCHYPLLYHAFSILPTPDLMDQMKRGEIKSAILMGGNPLVMGPGEDDVRETFGKLDFFVVIDPYMSETARELADVVLPAATWLERTEPEWFGYDRWYPYSRLRKKVTTVGEALPDWQIAARLGQKLGLEEYFPTDDIKYYVDLLFEPSGITYDMLDKNPDGIKYEEIKHRKYEEQGFALPGGKAHVYSEIFEQLGYEPLPRYVEPAENKRSRPNIAKEYPFIAFTGRGGPMYVHCQSRTWPWIRELRPEPTAMINSDNARELGICSNDWLSVESPRGEIKIKAEVTNKIGRDCVYIPGGWSQSNFNKITIYEELCPISSQQNYTSCLVRVSKTTKGGD